MKKYVVLLVCAIISFSAHAEILRWMASYYDSDANSTFSYGKLYAFKDGENAVAIGGNVYATTDEGYSDGIVPWSQDITGYANSEYSFFVTLYSSGGGVALLGETRTFDSLVSSGFVGENTAPNQPSATWNVVPEPCSSTLIALGFSLLLMRRRRVRVV